MDFHSMKRKQLQALCKKHKIPANLSNLEMANRISEALKGKDDPQIQRPIEGQDEHVSETESTDVIVNTKVKKVRFSPEHELIEFSRSPELKRRSRRGMAVSKSSSLAVVNVRCSDMNQENLGRPGRALRSRRLKSMIGNVDEKRGKSPEKGKGVNTDASAIEVLDNGKSQESDADSSRQEMMLRGKNRYNKSAKDDGKINEKAPDNVDNEKLIEKIVVNPGIVTRSTVQKLEEISAKEENRGRKVAKKTGNVVKIIAENKENKAGGTSSFTNRGDEDEMELANDPGEREKSKGKSLEEGLENKIVEVHDVNEPQIIRRSKRNTNKVADSEILHVDIRKNENGEGNGLRKKSKLTATNVSGVDVECNGSEVNPIRGVSSKMEEPIKVEPRRSNRRKNMIEVDELKVKTENEHPTRCSVLQLRTADEDLKDEKKFLRDTGRSRRKTLNVKLVSEDEIKTKRVLRGSVPELGISGDVYKDEKKVLQPTNVTRRSRRKTLSVKIVSADEKAHTHLGVEKLETKTENVCVLRGSVPQLGIVGEVSKDEKKVLQQTGTSMLGSKTSCFKPVDEENDINLAVENLKAEEHRTETCLVENECSAVQQRTRRSRRIDSQCKSPSEIGGYSDKVIKRKRGVMKTGNDPSSVAETMKETSSKKAEPAASSGKVVAFGKRRCRLDDFKVVDASSHNELEVGEHFVAKAQPSGSEGLRSTSNLGFSANTRSEGTHGRKPDASLADNEVSSDMKLIDRRELEDSYTNAAPKNTKFKTDFTDFEDDQVSVSNIRGMEKYNLPLEIGVHELLEQNITDMDKNDPEAHVLSETEDLGCNSKFDNQGLPEGSNVSGSEYFNETGSSTDSFLRGDVTDIKTLIEVTETEVDRWLQPSPNVVDHIDGSNGISVEENLGSDLSRKDNQVLPVCSKISEQEGLAETTSSADNPLPGDLMDFKTGVEVAEVEEEKRLRPNVCVVGELKVIAAQENLDSDETGQDGQVLPEVSKDSGNEGSAETDFSADNRLLADLEVSHAEDDKCLQPSPNVVDHVGVVKKVFVRENLDLDETGQDDQALPEVFNDSGKEDSAGTDSSADCHLLIDQINITTDLEVAQAEADKCLHTSPNVVDHAGVFKGVSVQENLDLDLTRKDQEGSNVRGNEGFADQIDIRKVANAEGGNRLQPSPGGVDHEVKGISVQENLDFDEKKQAYISSPVSCNRMDVDHLEKSDNTLDNNNEDTPPNAGAFESCERPNYTHSRSIINSKMLSSCVLRRVEGDNMTVGNEAFFHKVSPGLTKTDEDGGLDILKSESYRYSAFGIPDFSDGERSAKIVPKDNLKKGHEVHTDKSSNSEDGKTVEGEFYHNSRCDERGEFIVSNLFDAEARPGIMPQDIEVISDEYSLKDFDEQRIFHGSPSVAPTTICNSAKDHELDLIFEGHEASICKNTQSETVDADESGCLESHDNSKDEDWEFNISNLFDGERSARIKDSNKQAAIVDVPAISTTCENYNEVKFSADGSNLQEISPSKSQGQSKSPLADTTAISNIIQMPETCCNAIESAGNAMCLSKTNIIGSSADGDANDAECAKEIDDCSINKIRVEETNDIKLQDTDETEEQSTNMLEKESKPVIGEEPTDIKTIQSWTEIEFHNLFGTMFDNDTPGRNDISSSRTEAANLTSTNKSVSKIRDSLTKKEIEMEGERSDCEKIKNKNVVLPTSFSDVLNAALNVDMEKNQLATPIKKDETGSHGRVLDRTVISVIKCSDTMKENVVTQSKEKDALLDNGEGIICEGLNEVESVEMVNISSEVLSEAEYGGCGASQEQLTENTVECLKETNLKVEQDEEEKAIPLPKSCLYEALHNGSKLTERNCISSSDSPRNLVQLEGCQDMLTDTVFSQSISCKRICNTIEGDMTQSGEDGFGLSDANLQRSKKSNNLTAFSEDDSILKETSVETFRGHLDKVAEISMFGTSPCHFSKFLEYDEVTNQGDSVRQDNDLYGTSTWNEKDGHSRSSHDISDDNLEGDHEKTEKAAEESLTASMVQFSIPQLHFEEQAEDFNIHTHNMADMPHSECTETLKECDVVDTIKEYIDSESSLSMISDNSSLSFPIDETTHENAALSENNEDVAERFTNTEDEVEGSTANKPLVEAKGLDVKQKQIEAEDGQNSSFKQLYSTAKKNARTILIHGTPGKVPATTNMKENMPMCKSSNVGDLITVRPAKRKALQDFRWK